MTRSRWRLISPVWLSYLPRPAGSLGPGCLLLHLPSACHAPHTWFVLDPAEVVARGSTASLVSQHGRQLIEPTVAAAGIWGGKGRRRDRGRRESFYNWEDFDTSSLSWYIFSRQHQVFVNGTLRNWVRVSEPHTCDFNFSINTYMRPLSVISIIVMNFSMDLICGMRTLYPDAARPAPPLSKPSSTAYRTELIVVNLLQLKPTFTPSIALNTAVERRTSDETEATHALCAQPAEKVTCIYNLEANDRDHTVYMSVTFISGGRRRCSTMLCIRHCL